MDLNDAICWKLTKRFYFVSPRWQFENILWNMILCLTTISSDLDSSAVNVETVFDYQLPLNSGRNFTQGKR